MAKDLKICVLLDFYGELLTEKQADALDMYYNQDMSLAEIAEDMAVSRQGVRAFIKQGEAHLLEFEEKLGMAKRFAEISKATRDLKIFLEDVCPPSAKEELTKKIDDIKKLL